MNFQNARWIRAPFEQKSEVIVFRNGFDAGKKAQKVFCEKYRTECLKVSS